MKLKPLILSLVLASLTACTLPNALATPMPYPLPAEPAYRELEIYPPRESSTGPVSMIATASNELSDSPASNAIDGNAETIWNSGNGPEQWIMLDLGAPQTVSAIRLLVSQFPAGETIHQIWIGADVNNLTLLHEFRGPTDDSIILEFAPSAPLTNIQFIKIVTTQSPSWVAWREIEVESE